MSRVGLKSKLNRLEKQQGRRRSNHVLQYEIDAQGHTSPEVAAWLLTPGRSLKNAPAEILEQCAGILNKRVMLAPRFSSDEAWEMALSKQQNELVAKSRNNKPAPENVSTQPKATN